MLCTGGLHICFADLHSLGTSIDGSGIDTITVDTGIYSAAALRGIFGGKQYKRGIEFHIICYLSITMLMYDAILSSHDTRNVTTQSEEFRDSLHKHNIPTADEIF